MDKVLKRMIASALAGMLCMAAGAAAMAAPAIYIAGDSTAQDYGNDLYPQAGWGMYFEREFDGVKVYNRTEGGRGLLSFHDRGSWDKILNSANKGDYVFIQFGINDAGKYSSTYLSIRNFKDMLINTYIKGAEEKGLIPVILTPIPLGKPSNKGGYYIYRPYSEPIKEAAEETGCHFIDAERILLDKFNAKGVKVKDVAAKYLICEPLEFANGAEGTVQYNHFKFSGAKLAASSIADSLPETVPELAKYLKKGYTFADCRGHWAESYVNAAADKGIIDGVDSNTYEPDRAVTRDEFLKLIMDTSEICGHAYRKGECLDAKDEDFYSRYLQGALDKDLIPERMISGYKVTPVTKKLSDSVSVSINVYEGEFSGNEPITREEAAVLAANIIGQFEKTYGRTVEKPEDAVGIDGFRDNDRISAWARDGVAAAAEYGIFDGDEKGMFSPKSEITRAQAAKIISCMPELNL